MVQDYVLSIEGIRTVGDNLRDTQYVISITQIITTGTTHNQYRNHKVVTVSKQMVL